MQKQEELYAIQLGRVSTPSEPNVIRHLENQLFFGLLELDPLVKAEIRV